MVNSLLSRPTFGGLASGLDTNALLGGLLELERIPLSRMQSRRGEIDAQRGLMRELNSKLLTLRNAAQAIDNRNATGSARSLEEEFLRYEGSSTDEDIVTVSAGAGAAPGEVEVEVIQLARGSRAFSVSYADADTTAALTINQTIGITLPNGDPDAVPPVEATNILIESTAESGDLTLQDVRDQINTSPENGGTIRADVLRVGEDDYQLILTSVGTGTSNQINLTGDIAFQAPDLELDLATNAEFRLFGQGGDGGIVLSRETNVVDDALNGVTLRLNRVAKTDDGDPAQPVSEIVSIDVDVEEVAKGLEDFTKAYNDVMGFIDKQFRYNEVSKSAGPLSGDFTLRRVQSQLREMISTGFQFSANPSNPFAPATNGAQGGAISSIGIEIGGGGTLSVNKTKLEEALALDPRSVTEFLSGRDRAADNPANPADILLGAEPDLYDEGFAQLVATSLEDFVQSGDGLLASRDKAYADRLKAFDESIERFEFRLGQREETLIQRFSNLERTVSGLQGQQGFLSSLV